MIATMGTPVERYGNTGLWVKREDLSWPKPGPQFSKMRGVEAYIRKLDSDTIGVLDTFHSQAGHGVAHVCKELGKRCINYYPKYKADEGQPLRPQQQAALDLGAELVPLKAGRSAILFHQAKKLLSMHQGSHMMPNALKLQESVDETAMEFARTQIPEGVDTILIAASSGTIAAGVLKGINTYTNNIRKVIVHMGYDRSESQIMRYMMDKAGCDDFPEYEIALVNEGYQYSDMAKDGGTPMFPCNSYYDLKAFRWWERNCNPAEPMLLWNIG